MGIFKEYEIEVLQLLASRVLSPVQLQDLATDGELIGYEYTGSGYFLAVSHTSLPEESVVCAEPIVTGSAEGIVCGFVVYIGKGRLTIECHSWGDIEVPEGFRELAVKVGIRTLHSGTKAP